MKKLCFSILIAIAAVGILLFLLIVYSVICIENMPDSTAQELILKSEAYNEILPYCFVLILVGYVGLILAHLFKKIFND